MAADIGVDISGRDFRCQEHGRRIDPHGEEVKATAAFFSIVAMPSPVPCGTATKSVWCTGQGRAHCATDGGNPTVEMWAFPTCFRSVAGLLDAGVTKLKASTVLFWLAPHADVWPAAVPAINFDTDEEEEVGVDGAAGGRLPVRPRP